jgi:putative hydrolase of the HAD superfamily
MQFFRRWQPPKIISFDLDDTLYDNVPVMQTAEHSVQQYIVDKFPETAEWNVSHWRQLRDKVSQSDPALASDMTELRIRTLQHGLEQFGVVNAATHAHDIMDHFLLHRSNFEPPKESLELLQQLAERYELIALSNGNVDTGKIGLSSYFSLIVQPGNGVRGKPLPDMFLKAQQRFPAVKPAEFLHVGDHPYSDVLGAQRHGWQSVWLTSGLGRPQHLSILPTVKIDHLAQLKSLLIS